MNECIIMQSILVAISELQREFGVLSEQLRGRAPIPWATIPRMAERMTNITYGLGCVNAARAADQGAVPDGAAYHGSSATAEEVRDAAYLAMLQSGRNMTEAAETLGISRRTLQRWKQTHLHLLNP